MGWLLLFISAWLVATPAAGATIESSSSRGDRAQDAWTLELVVASLRTESESSVSFVEKTYSSLLTEPLIARGVLRFIPPSTLEKEIYEPYRERYVIEGDLVRLESERRHMKKTISLEDYPGLRGLVEAFRAGFTGNAVHLKEVYEATVAGDRQQWTLLLRPRHAAAKSLVDHILLSGSEGRLSTITVRAWDGDRSVMILSGGSPP